MSRQSLPVRQADEPADVGPEPCVGAAPNGLAPGVARPTARARLRAAWRSRTSPGDRARDAGMATAEYAIVTLAAAGFGGLLIVLLRSDEVRGLLAGLVRGALTP